MALVAELAGKGVPEPQARGTAGQMWRALHWVVDSETPELGATARVVAALQVHKQPGRCVRCAGSMLTGCVCFQAAACFAGHRVDRQGQRAHPSDSAAARPRWYQT